MKRNRAATPTVRKTDGNLVSLATSDPVPQKSPPPPLQQAQIRGGARKVSFNQNYYEVLLLK
jgi:hypothetical protein